MAILAFQKPDKVIMLESDDRFGRFEFRPLEPGYGITVGNALRRILISSLEGYAITTIKIDGVQHEFDTIPGIVDDVTQIILNLKMVNFKQIVPETDSETVTVRISGQEQIKAGDFNKFMHAFEVLNPEQVICSLSPETTFNIAFTINKGRGYVPADENASEKDEELGIIAIDSIHTPIVNVKYAIENYRVEQQTDYEKLTLEISTNGSIHPKQALKEAAKILIYHFQLFSDEKITVDESDKSSGEEFNEEVLRMRQLLKTRLTDMDLSVRALNCLKAANVETLGELVTYHRNDLLKFRNFGKKSLTELDDLLSTNGLQFGMETAKYKLDKD
ncbi:MAG: DNA-directed RNA polymerase subunit alpha [Marinilabiliaceae bacterium]|nr:DNA-directed RNA polymerase subunit alpha [Marinilabiliaceae bacterium]